MVSENILALTIGASRVTCYRHIACVIAVAVAPVIMTTVGQRRLLTTAHDIVQPDLTSAGSVTVMKRLTIAADN